MKYAVVNLTPDLLGEMITTGWRVGDETTIETVEGVPPGSRITDCKWDEGRHWMVLKVENEAFEDVPDAVEPPEMQIHFKTMRHENVDIYKLEPAGHYVIQTATPLTEAEVARVHARFATLFSSDPPALLVMEGGVHLVRVM